MSLTSQSQGVGTSFLQGVDARINDIFEAAGTMLAAGISGLGSMLDGATSHSRSLLGGASPSEGMGMSIAPQAEASLSPITEGVMTAALGALSGMRLAARDMSEGATLGNAQNGLHVSNGVAQSAGLSLNS